CARQAAARPARAPRHASGPARPVGQAAAGLRPDRQWRPFAPAHARLRDRAGRLEAGMSNSRTLFLLLAEFGTGQVPVERCCGHFGLSPAEAKAAASRQNLPVPVFRLGSQKSPWLVSLEALASYIDAKRAAAEDEWRRVHVA